MKQYHCSSCGRDLATGYVGIAEAGAVVCRVCWREHLARADQRNAGLRGLAAREVHEPPPPPKGDRLAE